MNAVNLWKLLREALTSEIPCALLLTVETGGSGPGRPGAAMGITSSGGVSGTVGGGIMEHLLVGRARGMLESGAASPEIVTYEHGDDGNPSERNGIPSGMICSGYQTTAIFPVPSGALDTVNRVISILEQGRNGTLRLSGSGISVSDSSAQTTHEFSSSGQNNWEYSGPLGLRDTVYIIGGGHVGQALARLLAELSFQPVIIDQRDPASFENPPACRWIRTEYRDAHNHVPEGRHSWVVIMTPFHTADAEVLESLSGKELRYTGMMASDSKKEKIYAALARKGVQGNFLERVHCPIGISIGSRTPPEIAVSITAQIVGIRSGAF